MKQSENAAATEVVPQDKTNMGLSVTGMLHLCVVYIVWSTTYLAIRIAVVEGSGFAPFSMGATRMFAAGFLLAVFAYFRRERLGLSAEQFKRIAISGMLLWVGGNGLVMWAEQYANSGYTALVVASTPVWTVLMDAVYLKTKPSRQLMGALIVGFIGLIVLLMPSIMSGGGMDMFAGIALIVASVSWSIGSIYQNRYPSGASVFVVSTYQHLFAGVVFTLLALGLKEPLPAPTTEAWLAWGYLVIFGSVLAFTSFSLALKLLPIHISTTYGYVNPVLALFFGWLLLGEPITGWTICGAILVLGSVLMIFHSRFQEQTKEDLG